jgi:CheY-like chemotaxis protein
MVYVLIVDDDEDDRDLFCDAVNIVDSSIQCIMARNGEEALEGLKRRTLPTPDLIFLDLNMPRLNGMQCLRALKKDSCFEHIPIVIYTTSKLKEDKKAAMQAGAAGFVTKPTSLTDLCEAITEILADQGILAHGSPPADS